MKNTMNKIKAPFYTGVGILASGSVMAASDFAPIKTATSAALNTDNVTFAGNVVGGAALIWVAYLVVSGFGSDDSKVKWPKVAVGALVCGIGFKLATVMGAFITLGT